MTNNPIPILLVVFLLKNQSQSRPPAMSPLEFESFLDSAHSVLSILDKVNGFAQSGGLSSLPDMKKILEVVEKIPL